MNDVAHRNLLCSQRPVSYAAKVGFLKIERRRHASLLQRRGEARLKISVKARHLQSHVHKVCSIQIGKQPGKLIGAKPGDKRPKPVDCVRDDNNHAETFAIRSIGQADRFIAVAFDEREMVFVVHHRHLHGFQSGQVKRAVFSRVLIERMLPECFEVGSIREDEPRSIRQVVQDVRNLAGGFLCNPSVDRVEIA